MLSSSFVFSYMCLLLVNTLENLNVCYSCCSAPALLHYLTLVQDDTRTLSMQDDSTYAPCNTFWKCNSAQHPMNCRSCSFLVQTMDLHFDFDFICCLFIQFDFVDFCNNLLNFAHIRVLYDFAKAVRHGKLYPVNLFLLAFQSV